MTTRTQEVLAERYGFTKVLCINMDGSSFLMDSPPSPLKPKIQFAVPPTRWSFADPKPSPDIQMRTRTFILRHIESPVLDIRFYEEV